MIKDHTDANWTEVIRPKTNPFDLRLKEVWKYRDLLILFVNRDFKAKYMQTILGPLWHVIQPGLTTFMSVLLFNVLAGIKTGTINPVLFQMSGIIIWNYFSTCLTATSGTFYYNANIFSKVYFPRLITPLSVICSHIIQFTIQFFLLVCTMCYFIFVNGSSQHFGVSWLMVPVVVLMMAGMGLGLGIIISSMTTKYRDLAVLVTFGVQLLMFVSAVNIPLEKYFEVGAKHPVLIHFVKWNPLATLVDTFRNAVMGGNIDYGMLSYAFVFMCVCLFLGALIFNRVEKTFTDMV